MAGNWPVKELCWLGKLRDTEIALRSKPFPLRRTGEANPARHPGLDSAENVT